MAEAFPSLPGWKARLAGRGIDAEASFRLFLGEIVGDANVDRVMIAAARTGDLPLPGPVIREAPVPAGCPLTAHEIRTLRRTAAGARRLNHSEKRAVRGAERKLRARNGTHAVALAIRRGWLPEYRRAA